jgi:heme exporter protein CcmD
MEKLTEVLAMGGYALYVWPAFIVAALAMISMSWISLASLKRTQKTLSQLQGQTGE